VRQKSFRPGRGGGFADQAALDDARPVRQRVEVRHAVLDAEEAAHRQVFALPLNKIFRGREEFQEQVVPAGVTRHLTQQRRWQVRQVEVMARLRVAHQRAVAEDVIAVKAEALNETHRRSHHAPGAERHPHAALGGPPQRPDVIFGDHTIGADQSAVDVADDQLNWIHESILASPAARAPRPVWARAAR